LSKARAEPVVRAAATNTQAPDAAWADKVETLSGIVQYRVSATCITMLGTAMLAKALNPDVNLFWFKPTHVGAADRARSYSARTLCHGVLVPLSAEYGFSLGVSGREPLNNQPFFRMERLDDATPVNPAAQCAFDYMMELIREVQALPNRAAAERALHAFIAVRRRYVTQYATAGEATIATPAALIEAVAEFMQLGSAGGSHAQAIAAGVMDAALDPERVESGRINDPSRHYPGDVCIWTGPEREAVARAIEVRDKPVSASDIHIFARRCQTEGVQDCAVLMVSQNQAALDEAALTEWADALGINLRLWHGWEPFIREALFWAEAGAGEAAATAAARARVRLTEAEVSAEALDNWDALTVRDVPA
jgi:hypothetical protein